MTRLARDRVLVPTDFSEASVDAIQTAQELVTTEGGLHVLYVLPPLDHTSPGVLLGDVDDETRRAKALHHLDEFLERNGVRQTTPVIVIGDPGLKIAEYVESNGIELIVMPSHGRHGVRRLLLGSVAERVLRHAPCPVLVLRRSDHD